MSARDYVPLAARVLCQLWIDSSLLLTKQYLQGSYMCGKDRKWLFKVGMSTSYETVWPFIFAIVYKSF